MPQFYAVNKYLVIRRLHFCSLLLALLMSLSPLPFSFFFFSCWDALGASFLNGINSIFGMLYVKWINLSHISCVCVVYAIFGFIFVCIFVFTVEFFFFAYRRLMFLFLFIYLFFGIELLLIRKQCNKKILLLKFLTEKFILFCCLKTNLFLIKDYWH